MTFEEYVYLLSGSKMTDTALMELFEREDRRDIMFHKLLEENCALKEKLRCHYPGKGELPKYTKTVLAYVIKDEHSMMMEACFRDCEWKPAHGLLGVGFRVVAWKFEEPPEVKQC